MCFSRLALSPLGPMYHLPLSPSYPLFSSLELSFEWAAMGRTGRTKPNAPSSPPRSEEQGVRPLPVSPPPLLLLSLGVTPK